jgi:hypothetical protein
MKIKCNLLAVATLALASTIDPQLYTVSAQGTAFTYQGQLNSSGSLANGSYDFKFTLFNALTNGSVVAGPITNSAVAVSNGLFTTVIDFGNVFDGNIYWLRIGVETNGAGGFNTLSPRQQLTPAPYAEFATTASNLSGTLPASQLSGTLTDGQLLNDAVTINPGPGMSGGGKVILGNTITLTNTGVVSVTGNPDITATTVSGAVTLGDTATATDTANTIVKRDSTGSFSVNNLTLDDVLTLPAPGSVPEINAGLVSLINADATSNFFAGLSAGPGVTGNNNTGVGQDALNLAIGSMNTAVGSQALFFNNGGNNNTAVGAFSLSSNVTGSGNTAEGYHALFMNINGSENTAIGRAALFNNTNGSQNTAVGVQALNGNQLGSGNIAIGYQAGFNNFGNNNIYIGTVGSGFTSDTIQIGTQGTQNQTYIAGIGGDAIGGTTVVPVVIDTTSGLLGVAPSSQRFKQDIQTMDDASHELLSLRPVTFKYKPKIDPEGSRQFGLIAEEVAKLDPDLVARDAKGEILTVRYEAINAMLLNEFLKEHRTVEEQQTTIRGLNQKSEAGIQKAEGQIDELKAENSELKARLEKLEQLLASMKKAE